MSPRSLLLQLSLLATAVTSSGATCWTPAALRPPSPGGGWHGNPSRPDVRRELQALEDQLLVDAPGSPRRQVLHVNEFGAVANDGRDDAEAVGLALNAACRLSQARYHATGPLAGERGVLVELRFGGGVFHIEANRTSLNSSDPRARSGKGYELSGCRYLLLNGENATLELHKPLANGTEAEENINLISFTHFDHVYVLNFTYDQLPNPYTIGIVDAVGGTRQRPVINLSIIEPQLAWPSGTRVRTVTHLDPWAGQSNHPSIHLYPGRGSEVCLAPNATVPCMIAEALGDTQPWQRGGRLSVNLPASTGDLAGGFQPGMWALLDGVFARPFGFNSGSNAVLQSITALMSGDFAAGNVTNFDIMDFHSDRCHGRMWNTGGGMTTVKGVYRVWHSTWDTGPDDTLNQLDGYGNVVAVDRGTNTVLVQRASSSTAFHNAGLSNSAVAGDAMEFAHSDDPFTAFLSLRIHSVVFGHDERKNSFANVTLAEPLPSSVTIGDVVCDPSQSPVSMHVKNVRAGNHRARGLILKTRNLLVEDSYLFNLTEAAFSTEIDDQFWYEGIAARNVVFRNNIVEAVNEDPHVNGGAIAIRAYTLGPDGRTYPSEARSGFRNLTIVNNTIIQTSGARWAAVHLGSSDGVTVANNHFVLQRGFNATVPIVAVCNSRNVTLWKNKVTGAPPGYLGGAAVAMAGQGCQTKWTSAVDQTNAWMPGSVV